MTVQRSRPTLAVIVPVLDEEAHVGECLEALIAHHDPDELLVVDGGSRDATCKLVTGYLGKGAALQLIATEAGRATQMNRGAEQSRADILLFLHADTRLPAGALSDVRKAIEDGARWGRFDVHIDARHWLLGVVARLMNLRSAWTGIATGDQAIFARTDTFRSIGGYAQLPLMEDIDLSRRLRRVSWPARLRNPVTTSGRRWEANGVLRTIMLMWLLRAAFALRVDPHRLARWYRNTR